MTSSPRLRLSLDTSVEGVESGRAQLLAFLEQGAFSDATRYAAELTYEEWMVNLRLHGYGESQVGPVEFDVAAESAAIVLRFEDRAPPFDPREAPEPRAPASAEEARVGGLGLMLMRRLSAGIDYARIGDRNVLTVRIAR